VNYFWKKFSGKEILIMLCITVKEGVDCFFMKKNGCQYNQGSCAQIGEECKGCQKIQDFPSGQYCESFPDPARRWTVGICNMATHVKAEVTTKKHKVNPIKASKRGH